MLEGDPKSGMCAVIKSWERLPGGKFGPIQKHGGVRVGDWLIRINDFDCTTQRFSQVHALLSDSNQLRKVLVFGSRAKYKEICATNSGPKVRGALDSGPGGPAFVSSVRMARVNQYEQSPFAEYEVVCRMRLVTNKVQKESNIKWCVWHRFSEFEELDKALRKQLGWQMSNISFPPKNSLTFNKLSLDFIETRRANLDAYWQQIMALDRIAEFHKHHASEQLKVFLDIPNHMGNGAGGAGGGDGRSGGGGRGGGGGGGRAEDFGDGGDFDEMDNGDGQDETRFDRASSKRESSRRGSVGAGGKKGGSSVNRRKQTLSAARRASTKRPTSSGGSGLATIEAAPAPSQSPPPAAAEAAPPPAAAQAPPPRMAKPPPPPPKNKPPPPPDKPSGGGGGGGGSKPRPPPGAGDRSALFAAIGANRIE